jgi:CRP-like cAMP-binding protein
MDERVRMLSGVPGLWDLQPDELLELSQLFELKVYDNENLCKEGDPPDALWVLGVGCIEVIKQVPSKGPFLVAELQPTCLVGHSGVVSISKRTATLRAKGTVEVLEMQLQSARVMLDTADFAVASPFRRAIIVAMCRQMGMATATVGRLAREAGIAEPADAEARLLRAEAG